MCGIAFTIGADKKQALQFVERANRLLKHRGPDGEGIFQDENVAMAHRRLAILDLSEAGAQPMITSDQRYVIVHNGEVYNHLELRAKFLADHPFKGHSDTETILALYAKMGRLMLQYLVGMWAFAIWDNTDKKLFISRDRYGQKPLYLRKKDNSFLFASEIKPLLQDGERPAMNPTAVVEYLALGSYGHLDEQTFFKDIVHFPQASYAEIKAGDKQLVAKPYWKLPDIKKSDKISLGSGETSHLRQIIEEAVSSQLLSDVTVGATLSGGLDSSTIVGLMASSSPKPFPVFTAQTKGSQWDESDYVSDVENKWGKNKLQLHWKELINTRISTSLPAYIDIQEEPFGDPSIMAHGFLMDMAKENNVKVVVGGQGGDELFFGYKNMTNNLMSSFLKSGSIGNFNENASRMGLGKKELIRIALGSYLPSLEKISRRASRNKRRFFIKSSLLDLVNDNHIILARSNNFYETWDESVNRVHLPHLVHYDDRNGMSRSIEGRMPFLDHRIADFVATLKPEEFLKNGESKTLLRTSCKDLLPETILNRKDKQGFFTPIHEMLTEDIDWIQAVIFEDKSISQLLDQKTIEEDIAFYRTGKKNNDISRRLWRVLSFCLWKKQFNVTL